MAERQLFRVNARRNGEWWALVVPGVPGVLTEVKQLGQASQEVREAIALLLEVPENSFDVEIVPDWRW